MYVYINYNSIGKVKFIGASCILGKFVININFLFNLFFYYFLISARSKYLSCDKMGKIYK